MLVENKRYPNTKTKIKLLLHGVMFKLYFYKRGLGVYYVRENAVVDTLSMFQIYPLN